MIDLGLGNIKMTGLYKKDGFSFSHTYTPKNGIHALVEGIGNYEQVPPECVLVTTGASLGLLSALCMLPKNSVVLCPFPYYAGYPSMIRNVGLQLKFYYLDEENNWEIEMDQLLRDSNQAVSAILLNLPGNPAGNTGSPGKLRTILDIANSRHIKVISDEVYADLSYKKKEVTCKPYINEKTAVIVKSFSKLFMLAGERIGYIIAHPDLIRELTKIHWSLAMSAPAYGQFRALQLLQQSKQTIVSALLNELTKNRTMAHELLVSSPFISCKKPDAGIFYWIKIDKPEEEIKQIHASLNHNGVIVTPGHVFGEKFNQYMRINFAVDAFELKEGLHQLLSLL